MKAKIKVGIFSLTSCEGCLSAILDAPAEFLSLREKIEIVNFRLFEEDKHNPEEQYDIAFVEGSPLTQNNIEQLKDIRRRSKILIALGVCAHLGGIYHLKQYQDKIKIFNLIYNKNSELDNFDVQPLSAIVKVDFIIPGCPITAGEFYGFVYQLLIAKQPNIKQKTVCYECQTRGYECALQQGKACLGPITVGGCGAICLKSKQGCWGCRGLIEDAEVANLIKKLREKFTDKEIAGFFEVFGLKEQIQEIKF